MNCSVDVGVVVFVEISFGFDYLFGFLCCGGVVEVDEGVTVDLAFKNGEVIAQLAGI